MRGMRWLMCVLAVAGYAGSAAAADFGIPALRGSNAFDVGAPVRWDGIYFGGQFGTTIGGANFDAATSGLASLLRINPINTPSGVTPLGATDHAGGLQYGGFVGYNGVWDGAVLGIEANYTHLNTTLTATNTMVGSYATADGSLTNTYAATGTASVHLSDYGSLRVRGGWAAGNFMPYMTAGFAVAHATFDRTVAATFTPPAGSTFVFTPPFAPLVLTTTQDGFAYGYTLGAGVDFALSDCFFVRAEYEYAAFGDFQQVNMHLHSARLAAAYKF